MKLRKAIPRLRFERRRLYAQSKVCPPEMRREYRERAEEIGGKTVKNAEETRRIIWRHPKGIYETVEVSGTGVFGVPYSYRETVYTANRDARGVAHKEIQPAPPNGGRPAGGPRIPLTDKEEKEICEMYETMPLAIVAASMHRSSKTVRAVLEKHGVTMRKYGPRTKKNH